MIEIPIVIIDVQRMGPATGGPTIGAYGDVQFVRWGNSGGYPIIALTPTDVTDCYNLTLKAFELAERFRVPVFLLTDREIGLSKSTVETSNFNKPNIPTPEDISFGSNTHHLQNNNLSEIKPFSPLGKSTLVRITTSSHNEDGYLTKDPKPIGTHNKHLAAKINDHIAEITSIRQDLQPNADILIISYGITSRSAEEAVSISRENGKNISHLIIHSLWPVPSIEIVKALINAKHVIIPELNLGLYKHEIERFAGDEQTIIPINKLDGSLISPQEIVNVMRTL
jgi:2-oxoglutarate ferredoxin oxidoreductase subunit alpha